MTILCGKEIDPCLRWPDIEYIWDSGDTQNIVHSKDIKTDLKVGSTVIPLRTRKREFSLDKHDELIKEDLSIIYDLQDYDSECYTRRDIYSLSINENISITDSDIYILDTDHNNCFWKEYNAVCLFNKTSTDSARFNAPSNTYHKWILGGITADVTITWKLMINGVVTTLLSESYTKQLYSSDHPLIILWPIPLITGIPVDEDIINYGYFYDYFAYGEQGLIRQDGGADFYYPEWHRMIGLHHEEDQEDAYRRYDYTWGSDPNRKASYQMDSPRPAINGPNDPRGSIVRDFRGNTFSSVTVTKVDGTLVHFNKLVDKDGKEINIPDTIPGSDLRYYPVGLI
jgi:hypothetical protein